MSLQVIDLDTPQTGGGRGDAPRTAFTKINDNFAEAWSGGLPYAKTADLANLPYIKTSDSGNLPYIKTSDAGSLAYVKNSPNPGLTENISFFLDGNFADESGPIYGVVLKFDANHLTQFYVVPGGTRIRARIKSGGNFIANVTLRHTGNTVVDSNGFIKQASPVFRLASESAYAVDDDQDFLGAGAGAANTEAQGVTADRLDIGVYRIKGAESLATSGWTVELPKDVNGVAMCFVEVQADDGHLLVLVSRRRVESGMVLAGEPMDVPAGRWIDLRLKMPDL